LGVRSFASDLPNVAAPTLAAVRKSTGSSDQGLADHLGIDRSMISKWRSGERGLPIQVLPVLAEFCGRPDLLLAPLADQMGVVVSPCPERGGMSRLQALREAKRCMMRCALAIEEATADGQIDDAEQTEIDSMTAEVRRFLAMCDAPAGPRVVAP